MRGSADAIQDVVAEDFYDHVSGQRGRAIWDTVASWSKATFADSEVDVHEIMTRGDRVLIWVTVLAVPAQGA